MGGMAASAYRELPPPPGLEAHVACLWTSHDGPVRVLPDACVDVVFSDGRLVVAGPATAAAAAPATPGRPRLGLRFRMGSAGAALAVPAAELLDRSVPLAELWGPSGARLEARVAAAASPGAALAALTRGIAARLPSPAGGDPLVRAAIVALLLRDSPSGDCNARLRRDSPSGGSAEARVAALAREVGLGERQLRRRFERAVGYGPATLARVQRFQRFLALAQDETHTPLARLAADAGYADQAHLTRECRRLSGLPPAQLLAGGAAPAGERSDAFKPAPAAAGTLAA
jgi:AraC-like DNA-binding protein